MRRHSISSVYPAPSSSSSSSSSASHANQSFDGAPSDERVPTVPALSAKAMVVAVRIRPLSSKEIESGQKSCINVINNQTIAIKRADATASAGYLKSQMAAINEYGFDAAFDEYATQMQVYQATAAPFIPNLLAGLNVTVFAYGATGSGKTHTMLGNTRADEAASRAEGGIIPCTVNDLFAQIDSKRETAAVGETWAVSVTFVEIYNEQVYDLLEPTGKILQLREDQEKGTVVVAGVTEQPTPTARTVFDMLAKGNGNRKTEATMANQVSSRSHAVLQLTLRHSRRTESGRDIATESKLSLIDLAGSERASATNNRGARLQEGANINKSLLALGNCINSLASNANAAKRLNVKYRDSRLTHLLKSSLEGGNCNLVMIANVNPSDLTYEDSHNTLKYANRAKNIKVDPRSTALTVESTWVERETRLREENARLRRRVEELEALVTSLRAGHTITSEAVVSGVEIDAEEDCFVPDSESIMDADIDQELLPADTSSIFPVDQSMISVDPTADAPAVLAASAPAVAPATAGTSDCMLEEMETEAAELDASLPHRSDKKRPRESDVHDSLSDSVLMAGLDADASMIAIEDVGNVVVEVEVEDVVREAPNKKRRASLLPQPKSRASLAPAQPHTEPALAPTQPTTSAPSDRRTRRNSLSAAPRDENANPNMQQGQVLPSDLVSKATGTNSRRKSLAAVSAMLDALPGTSGESDAGLRVTRSSATKLSQLKVPPVSSTARGLSTRRRSIGGATSVVQPVSIDGWMPQPSQVFIDI